MPYGAHLEKQNQVLDEMEQLICTMRCVGKHSIQTFQKAIKISIASLKLLFQDMKNKYDIKYILTHRLNQDVLENFFSQIRTRGGLHDHPSPLNSLHRIRIIILGKNPGVVRNHANTQTDDSDEYIVARVIKRADITLSDSDFDISGTIDVSDTNISSNSEMVSVSNYSIPSECQTVTIVDSSPSGSSFQTVPQCEEDGLQYIAGYVAAKFKDKYPDLGDYTHKLQATHDYCIPSWVQHLSFGGLVKPSDKWMNNFHKIEKHFIEFHGNDVQRGENVLKRTTEYVPRYISDVPFDVVHTCLRTRLFIRIKYLNISRKQTKRSGDKDSKLTKKYKKLKQ